MFISLIIKGGPVMIPIIALSIIGLALILELQRYLNWEFSIELWNEKIKIKTHRDSIVSLESVAITNIILNMFIFFLTSFSLVYTLDPAREYRIIVKLPQADIKMPVDQIEPIVVTINNRSEIFLKNQLKSLRDLKTEMESLIAFNKTRPVIVPPDRSVVFDWVVQVLDVAKNAGVERLGIAIEEKTPSKSPNLWETPSSNSFLLPIAFPLPKNVKMNYIL